MGELEEIVDTLLVRGYHMTSLELFAEMRSKNESPPGNLAKFFSDPAKFESSLEAPIKRLLSSPILFENESEVLSDKSDYLEKLDDLDIYDGVEGEGSKDESLRKDDESKALLKYQLRLAKEEIEFLKVSGSAAENRGNIAEISEDSSFDEKTLDSLVLDYLESRGFEYSASTLCDEAGIDNSIKQINTLKSLLSKQCTQINVANGTAPTDDTYEKIENLEEELRQKTARFQETKDLLKFTSEELKSAQSEIERFSTNLVQNILDTNHLDMSIVTAGYDSESEEEFEVEKPGAYVISEPVWNMILSDEIPMAGENNTGLVAANLEELLVTIKETIEPLLSGILLKHRPHLIPLLLSSALLSTDSEAKELFLKNLFNLIKVSFFRP
jgi:hypothetical protein